MHRSSSFPVPGVRVALVVLIALVVPGAAGCRSKEEQLADARRELVAAEDALFRTYGGSEVAAEVDQQARAAGQPASTSTASQPADPLAALVGQVVGNAARELDREMFANDCRRLGHGERVPFLTDKGRTFFGRPDTETACRKIATLADTVARLEGEMGLPAAPR
jgi:hypothetical protein